MRARRPPILVVAALAAIAFSACGDDKPATSTPTTPTPTNPLPAMSVMLSEKVLGNANAPVTMIEYSSLSCPHCGDFHGETLPLLKATYVDTGRMKVVYRDFPLNEAATAGAMVARCSGDNFFTTLGALYRAQASWAYASDYKSGLKTVVATLGISSSDVEACLASSELRSGILAIKTAGVQTYGINGTPTFVINGQKVVGAVPFAQFAAVIDAF